MLFKDALLLFEDELLSEEQLFNQWLQESTDLEGLRLIPVQKQDRIKVRKKHLYRDHRNILKVRIPADHALVTDPKGQKWLIKKRITKKGDQPGPVTDSTIKWDPERNMFVYVVDKAGAYKAWREKRLLNKRTAKKRARSAALTRRKTGKK